MDGLFELFCLIDDFCQEFEPHWKQHLLTQGQKKRWRRSIVSLSEVMTLVVLFHQLRHRQFKRFYLDYACQHLCAEFPYLPSYSRLVELMPRCAAPLAALFEWRKGRCTGLSILDSMPLAVCVNLRIRRHRVFRGLAARGKSSTGWFYGFKLHVIINHRGELLSIKLTPGNVDDRKPVPSLCAALFGKLYGDKGYISQWLREKLRLGGVDLITKVRKNMQSVAHSAFDQAILKRRSLIETVIDVISN
jgi:transposase